MNNEILPGEETEEPVNTEDVGLIVTNGNLNTETGLWEYPSLSTHRPKELMDQQLMNVAQNSDKFATTTKIDETCGLKVYHLKPRQSDVYGNPRQCDCGGEYNGEDGYKQVQEITLYTCFAPLKCLCYNLVC